MSGIDRTEKIKAAYPITALLSLCGFFGGLKIYTLSQDGTINNAVLAKICENNMMGYFFALAVFLFSFLALRAITSLLPEKAGGILEKRGIPAGVSFPVSAVLVFLGTITLINVFTTSRLDVLDTGVAIYNGSVVYSIPDGLLLFITLAVCALGAYLRISGKELSKKALGGCYAFILVTMFFSMYTADLLTDDIFHTIAYVQPIINVLHKVPYDRFTSGIYGHYGILIAPVTALLGGRAESFPIIIALLSLAVIALFIYVAKELISDGFIRVLALFGSIVTYGTMRDTLYYQCQPHRIIFPMLIAAYILFTKKREISFNKKMLIGFLICSLSIVWNTETGLFCTAAYAASLIVEKWQTKKWNEKECIALYGKCILLVAASLVLAIGIVNVYNLLCGGGIIIKDFFFPLFESDYMVEGLGALGHVVWSLRAWIFVLILLAALLLFSLSQTVFIGCKEPDKRAPLICFIAAVGLMNFVYYANRPLFYNLDICLQVSCLAIGFFTDRYKDCVKNIRKEKSSFTDILRTAYSVVGYLTLCLLAFQAVFVIPKIQYKAQHGFYSRVNIEDNIRSVEGMAEDNIFFIGSGSDLLYQELKRENRHYYRNLSDLYIGGNFLLDKITEDAGKEEEVLVLSAGGTNTSSDVLREILAKHQDFYVKDDCPIITGDVNETLFLLSKNVDKEYGAGSFICENAAENGTLILSSGMTAELPYFQLPMGEMTFVLMGEDIDSAQLCAYDSEGNALDMKQISSNSGETVYSLYLPQRTRLKVSAENTGGGDMILTGMKISN